ncbi:MAG TPA: hypothetical protein VH575_02835 [Gemmataceae bacterium]|jgi:hypothetical protein
MNQPMFSMPVPSHAPLNGHAIKSEGATPNVQARTLPPIDPLRINYRAILRLVIALSFLFVSYLIGDLLFGENGRYFLNRVGPISLLVACLWTAYEVIRSNPNTLWTPIPWFVAGSGFFFGLGPLAYSFGDEAMIAIMDDFFPVGPRELWRTNVLNVVGIILILTAFLGCSRFMDRRRPLSVPDEKLLSDGRKRIENALYVFLAIGLPIQYLLILPYEFGQLSFTLPGSIHSLSGLVPLCVFILAYLAVVSGGRWKVFFWTLLCSEIVMESLRFNKSAFLIVLIMAVFGRYLALRRMVELVLGTIFVFLIYVAITPVVDWGRNQIVLQSGDHIHATLEQRLNIAADGIERWTMGRLELHRNGGWWRRLCYVNSQTLVMSMYDNGSPGTSFQLVIYGPVPRFIWPEKPILAPGRELTELAGGGHKSTSQTGIGPVSEAYWNGGWPLVVLSCCYIGIVLTWLSRSALLILARSEWLLLPCAFLGIQTGGAGVTEWFATTFVNGMILYLAYYLLIKLFLGMNRNRV